MNDKPYKNDCTNSELCQSCLWRYTGGTTHDTCINEDGNTFISHTQFTDKCIGYLFSSYNDKKTKHLDVPSVYHIAQTILQSSEFDFYYKTKDLTSISLICGQDLKMNLALEVMMSPPGSKEWLFNSKKCGKRDILYLTLQEFDGRIYSCIRSIRHPHSVNPTVPLYNTTLKQFTVNPAGFGALEAYGVDVEL